MKVFILTTITAPYRINLFNELGKKCNLRVCFEQKRDLVERNNKWYDSEHNNFDYIALKNWDKSLKRIKWDAFKYLTEFNPDFVIAYEYSTPTALMLMSFCRLKRIPYFINCDGAIPSNNYLRTLIKKHYIKNAVGYFGNGISARKYFLKYNGKEEKIIPYKFSNYYKKDILEKPLSKIEKEQKKEDLGIKYKKVFLSIGRFEFLKGFDLLIDLAQKYKENEEIGFVFIGGGPLEEQYKKEIEEKNLKNITILPYMDKEQLMNYYDISDCFIFPTRRDIWGLVVVEAMSRGLPVITSDDSMAGIELVEDSKNGYIFKSGDTEKLKEAIDKLISMDNQMLFDLGEESINRIKDYYIEKMAEDHYNALEKTYKGKEK